MNECICYALKDKKKINGHGDHRQTQQNLYLSATKFCRELKK